MLDVLGVPEVIRTECGFNVRGREALCILLYRMAYPCRLKDMRLVFGLSESCICETFNYMIHFLDHTWGPLLDLDVERLVPKLEGFAKALVDIGCPMSNVWGFIDGTVRGISRPKRWQRIYYNGHKRKHAIKFQGVVTPDGLFVHLFGPIVGSRHDNFLLSESGLLAKLQTHMNTDSGEPYCLYGDPAYGVSPHLNSPFNESRHGPLTPAMQEFNYRMSACRVTVQWGFKEMTSKWAFICMKEQQKVLLSAVGKQYRVATLLSNFHSCLNGGNEISQFFGVQPPSLEEYLGVDAL